MIDVAGLVVGTHGRLLVDGLTLTVDAGEIHALLGPSGAGKSVTLDVLMGHRRPTRGVCQILGYDCDAQRADVRRCVTHVVESGSLDAQMTVRQFVAWILQLSGLAPEPVAIRRALRAAEISDQFFDRQCTDIPPLDRIFTWLAIAELRRHHVVFLDDPTRSLSSSAAHRVGTVLQSLRSRGHALLLATRDAAFAETFADRITTLEDGRMIVNRHSDATSPRVAGGLAQAP
jgi:ABC-2 type transport system ATP-binding protein